MVSHMAATPDLIPEVRQKIEIALARAKLSNLDAVLAAVLHCLGSMGVRMIEDLEQVNEDDLTDINLSKIDARKVINTFYILRMENTTIKPPDDEKEESKKVSKPPAPTSPFKAPKKPEEDKFEVDKKSVPSTISFLPRSSKTIVKILLLGKTGAGKSTLINAAYNFIKGVKYEDSKFFVIPCPKHPCNVHEYKEHSKEAMGKTTDSQTQQCFSYCAENEFYRVILIDTPGIGDTRGPETDAKNIKDILEGIKLHADVNAVCLVHSMSDVRKDIMLRYYLSEIKGILPKRFKDNFIICFTRGVGPEKGALSVIEEMGLSTSHFIKVENSCLVEDISMKDKENYEQNRAYWNRNRNACFTLLDTASKMHPYATQEFLTLSSTKTQLVDKMEQSILDLKNLDAEKKSLSEYQEKIKKCEATMKENEQFVIENVIRKEVVDESKPKNTVCDRCKTICHEDCRLRKVYVTKGDPQLLKCGCMIKGRCRDCKCPIETHVHKGYQFKFEETRTTQVCEAKKSAFNAANKDKATTQGLLKECTDRIAALEKAMDKELQEIADLYYKIKQVSLLPYNDACEEYLSYAIKTAELGGKSNEVARFKDIKENYERKKRIIEKVGKK